MKNNLKALGLHLIIVMLSLIYLVILVSIAPTIGKYTNNSVIKGLIGISFIFLYIFAGTLLDINTNKRYDFLVGCIIGIVGICLWVYTFSITGRNLFEVQEELREYWILMNTYLYPFIVADFPIKISSTPLLVLLVNFFPSMLMASGLKYKRLKIMRN
jgi:hypothetical protein